MERCRCGSGDSCHFTATRGHGGYYLLHDPGLSPEQRAEISARMSERGKKGGAATAQKNQKRAGLTRHRSLRSREDRIAMCEAAAQLAVRDSAAASAMIKAAEAADRIAKPSELEAEVAELRSRIEALSIQ